MFASVFEHFWARFLVSRSPHTSNNLVLIVRYAKKTKVSSSLSERIFVLEIMLLGSVFGEFVAVGSVVRTTMHTTHSPYAAHPVLVTTRAGLISRFYDLLTSTGSAIRENGLFEPGLVKNS